MTDAPITKKERTFVARMIAELGYVAVDATYYCKTYEAALSASEAEVARLKEALRQISEAHYLMIEPDFRRIARKALTGETDAG